MTARIFSSPHALLDAIGVAMGPTDWMIVGQERIDQFAAATGDHQWIHVDQERAAAGPFGGTIAHGYLTLALISSFLPSLLEVQNVAMGLNVGIDRLRFLAPVPAGARLRARAELLSAEEKGGCVQVTLRVIIELDGADRPACIFEPVFRYYPRPQSSDA